MTREKKEIQKKIDRIEEMMHEEEVMGCGFLPDDAFDREESIINRLEVRMAHLQHYKSLEEKEADTRWLKGCPELKEIMGFV